MPRFEERFDYINDSHFDMAEETEKFIIEKLEQEITTQQKTSSLKYNFSC